MKTRKTLIRACVFLLAAVIFASAISAAGYFQNLKAYKIEGETSLKSYADGLENKIGYSENIEEINAAVDAGRSEIFSSISIDAIDEAVKAGKNAVDGILLSALLQKFDLTDEKVLWKGSVEDNFTDDLIIVVFKRTTAYPVLDLSYFNLDNAERLEYVNPRPSAYFYLKGNEDLLKNYRQIAYIHIKPQGKKKVAETIRALEKLEFIYAAEPNNTFFAEPDNTFIWE